MLKFKEITRERKNIKIGGKLRCFLLYLGPIHHCGVGI
jgi:hypothetical protein